MFICNLLIKDLTRFSLWHTLVSNIHWLLVTAWFNLKYMCFVTEVTASLSCIKYITYYRLKIVSLPRVFPIMSLSLVITSHLVPINLLYTLKKFIRVCIRKQGLRVKFSPPISDTKKVFHSLSCNRSIRNFNNALRLQNFILPCYTCSSTTKEYYMPNVGKQTSFKIKWYATIKM